MNAVDAAWQAALAAEQRAVFGYSVLGPHLSGGDRSLAADCSDAHESLRDATSAAMTTAQLTPQPPLVDYPDVYPVTGARRGRTLAAELEDDCARAWRYLFAQAAARGAAAGARLRPGAQEALTASAVRAVRWRRIVDPGNASTPFPGVPSS